MSHLGLYLMSHLGLYLIKIENLKFVVYIQCIQCNLQCHRNYMHVPVNVDSVGILTTVDIDFTVDDDTVIDELNCVLNDEVSSSDVVIGENVVDELVDKLVAKLEDDNTVGGRLMNGSVDVTLGIGIVALCEMSGLNVTSGITPLTALPRGVTKSRLTAVAVNKYGLERFRLLKDPSTISFLPTTGIV